ncbi:hypothetical protein CRUP_011897 [Coryphaenoides rupestris]|nr:hypothetical protein CRUP_011897 [Coryphaenoides rupestris]
MRPRRVFPRSGRSALLRMASAQPGVHALTLQTPRVGSALRNGSNFTKWDEDLSTVTPVTLHVDPNGFYLYWTDQNKAFGVR